MSINETIKSIHRLATLRDAPSDGVKVSVVLSPHLVEHPSIKEPADGESSWVAQTYMGKGHWGNLSGFGPTPEAALSILHVGLLNAHLKLDERRGQVLKAAQEIRESSGKATDSGFF